MKIIHFLLLPWWTRKSLFIIVQIYSKEDFNEEEFCKRFKVNTYDHDVVYRN